MGCANSVADRSNSPATGAQPRPQRGPAVRSAQTESAQGDVSTSVNDVELPGAVPEQGDAATSSRMRARPARNSTRDSAQQEPSLNTTIQSPVDADLPNTVPEQAVSSFGTQGPSQRAILPQPASEGQVDRVLPAAAPCQQDDKSEAVLQRADEATRTVSGTSPPIPAAEAPLQQQQPQAAATAVEPQTARAELEQLLARVSSAPQRVADGRKLVLLVWDIEHVRCPQGNSGGKQSWKHPLSPQNVLGCLKQHFIYSRGRMDYRTVAALSEGSLRNILKHHKHFVELAVPNLSLLLAAKSATGAVLEKEMRGFMAQHAHVARKSPGQLTIVLVARDDHFIDIRREAADAGFCVEVMPPRQWVDFLRRSSGQRTVKLVK